MLILVEAMNNVFAGHGAESQMPKGPERAARPAELRSARFIALRCSTASRRCVARQLEIDPPWSRKAWTVKRFDELAQSFDPTSAI